MAAAVTILEISHKNDNFPARTGRESREQVTDTARYLRSLASGARGGTQIIRRGHAVQGSATVTCAGVLAADTVTLNGVTFTAVTGAAAANQFDRSGTNAQTAANLANAINTSVTAKVAGVMGAISSNDVCLVFCIQPGFMGILATLTSSNGTRLAVSASPFQNAASDAAVTYLMR